MAFVIGGLILVFIVVAFWLGPSVFGSRKSFEDELILLCRGDRSQLERLIALEQKRHSGWSRERAAKAAIYSLKRDNR